MVNSTFRLFSLDVRDRKRKLKCPDRRIGEVFFLKNLLCCSFDAGVLVMFMLAHRSEKRDVVIDLR